MSTTIKPANDVKTRERDSKKRPTFKTRGAYSWDWRTFLPMLLFGLVFTLGGALVLWFMLQVNVLTCTRLESTQYNCVLQSKLLSLVSLHTEPIIGLQGAKLKQEVVHSTSTDSNGRSRTRSETVYWVVLVTSEGEVSLDNDHSSWIGPKQDITDQINAFVDNPEVQSLQVHSDLTYLLLIPIPFIFLAIGLLLIIVTVGDWVMAVSNWIRSGFWPIFLEIITTCWTRGIAAVKKVLRLREQKNERSY